MPYLLNPAVGNLVVDYGHTIDVKLGKPVNSHTVDAALGLETVLDQLDALDQILHHADDLDERLGEVVQILRDLLKSDRVLIYQFLPTYDGLVSHEAVSPNTPAIIGQLICDPCFQNEWALRYTQGHIKVIEDVAASDLAPCHQQLLQEIQVKANLVVPICLPQPWSQLASTVLESSLRQQNPTAIPPQNFGSLWGLIIAQQCDAPRQWSAIEIQLMRRFAVRVGEALQERKMLARLAPAKASPSPLESFHSIFQRSQVGASLLNVDGYFAAVNPQFCQFLGYSEAELRQRTYLDVTFPEDHAESFAVFQRLMARQAESIALEKRYVRQDGEVVWVTLTLSSILDGAGQMIYALGVWVDISEHKRAEAALFQQTQRERMIVAIAQEVRQSLDLQTLLNTTVAEVRHFLQTDRVIVYRFEPDWSGVVMAESVRDGWQSLLHQHITDSYFVCNQGDQSNFHTLQQTIYTADDIYTAGLSQCHVELLEGFQVKAKLVVPIWQGERLWGLLVVHQCRGSRAWQPFEGELLQQLATQVAIAIQQSELYQQVQQLNVSLEHTVQQRTQQLQKALDVEAALKRITDKVRDSLDERQILQTSVNELAKILAIESCDAGIYTLNPDAASPLSEVVNGFPLAQSFSSGIVDHLHPSIYQSLLNGSECQFCLKDSTLTLAPEHAGKTVLACPIVDDRGGLGTLWLLKAAGEVFDDIEMRLVRQVANQCAIALRQSRLYQSAQNQVQELQRLNQLKDDFLSTVSHELRTPMSIIQQTIQMLHISLQDSSLQDSSLQDSSLQDSSLQDSSLQTAGSFSVANPSAHQYLQILQDECDREIAFIDDLLDLIRLEAGTEPLNLRAVHLQFWVPHLSERFLNRMQTQDQHLILDIPNDLPLIISDIAYLERLLLELLNNACKYTPAHETITVRVSYEGGGDEEGGDRHSLNPLLSSPVLGAFICIQVINTGVEIPPEEGDRIFEKFYRIPNNNPWQYSGTGLGLALARRLAATLKGSLTVGSDRQQTTFTLRLPLSLD